MADLQNGNALFSLQLVGVHGALVVDLHSSRPQKRVNKSSLAVIDVSNDGHVSCSFEKLLGVAGHLGYFAEPSTGLESEEGRTWSPLHGPCEQSVQHSITNLIVVII